MPDDSAERPSGGVSVIVTVRNDREGLAELLPALAAQTEMPDEIVIVDGGSSDDTLDALEDWKAGDLPIRSLVAPGTNIAAGRNVAVRTARGDWIACTDAGCRPEPGWLAALNRHRGHADVAAGVFVVEADSPFEQAVAYTYYPVLDELRETSALVRASHRLFGREFEVRHPSGSSLAFSRAAWEVAGGFPEKVYAGEDQALVVQAIEKGCRAVLVPDAVIRRRSRETWRENAQMFRIYAPRSP